MTVTEGAPRRLPRWVRVLHGLSLAAGGAGLAWLLAHAGFGALRTQLAAVGGWFVAVLAAHLASNLIDARIIQLVVRAPAAPLPYRDALVAQLAGHGVNLATPGGNLGELTKVARLHAAGAQHGRAVSGILVFNLAAAWVNVCVLAAGIAVIAARVELPREWRIAMWAGAGVCLAFGLALALVSRRGALPRVARALGRLRVIGPARVADWSQRLGTIDDQLAEFRGARAGDLVRAAGLSVISHLTTQAEAVLVLYALGVPLAPGFVIAVMAAGMVVRWTATVVPFGVGVSEGGNYALFELLGVAPVAGLVLALVQRGRQLVFVALGLGLLLWAQARDRAPT